MILGQKSIRISLSLIAFMLSNSAASQTPQSIYQFCKILERDILSYYQIEMDNNVKYTNAKLPMSERNQALEIARSIKDMRIQFEGSWQRKDVLSWFQRNSLREGFKVCAYSLL